MVEECALLYFCFVYFVRVVNSKIRDSQTLVITYF